MFSYVEQNNIHQPFVTVKEALEFSATLRLPRSTSINQRKAFVEEVVDYCNTMLDLSLEVLLLVGGECVDSLHRVINTIQVTLMLELEDIQNNLVGSIGDSGLSLEEAKRLTIGVELVCSFASCFFLMVRRLVYQCPWLSMFSFVLSCLLKMCTL